MLRYRDGDAASFDQLYQRHKDMLYRYMLRQCQNHSIAEELYQDVWMKLINARENYQVKAKFTTYLFQMAHHRVIDHYRRNKIRAINSKTDDQHNPEFISLNANRQPDQKADIENQVDRLLQLVDNLSSEQRETFLLREDAGMTIDEIAQATGVKPETAKSRLRYAVEKLRKSLGDTT